MRLTWGEPLFFCNRGNNRLYYADSVLFIRPIAQYNNHKEEADDHDGKRTNPGPQTS